jgi:hypothetical protein
MTGRQRLLAIIVLALLCGHGAQADRVSRKTIEAVTAIDVGLGVEQLQRRAALPWALSQALVYSGVRVGYADLCVVSGWSGGFSYAPEAPAGDSLLRGTLSRGVEMYGKRLEFFAWPEARTEEERIYAARAAWEFILSNIAADRPVISDYGAGGLFYGYDTSRDEPVAYFDTLGPSFGAVRRTAFSDGFRRDFRELAVIVDGGSPVDAQALLVSTMAGLLVKAHETGDGDRPAGIRGMSALAADLLDNTHDWTATVMWLADPLAQITESRLCTAAYLRRRAELLEPPAREHVLAAADLYNQAFDFWCRRWDATWGGANGDERHPALRLAEPGRRDSMAGYVHQALGAELLALSEIGRAIAALEGSGETP